VRPRTLDHVALWVADRDALANLLTRHVGMHVIERTDRFTLVGADARRGKLTLFAAEGPRERGVLEHVALRVSDLDAAAAELPGDLPVERDGRSLYFDAGEGLRFGLVEAATDSEYDLDHVALRVADPDEAAGGFEQMGFADTPATDGERRLEVGGAFLELRPGGPAAEPERPLLNHLAVLVDSAEEHRIEAEDLGLEVADVVDAPNTYAVFLWGPARVRVEYVEHKPTFSLA
jgi:catechol 2,3-dioxygenase-like lactoylglutathione lyase family enzyme